MGNIVNSAAFLPPTPPSYDITLPNLTMIKDRIPALFFRYQCYTETTPTILFTHGNATDIGEMNFEYLSELLHVNVCGYDYAGYGTHSIRTPSEAECFEDIRLVYEYLVVDCNIPRTHIIIYGQSLGSGPTCYLADLISRGIDPITMEPTTASNPEIGGVILHSAIESAIRVVSKALSYSGFDIFQNYKRVTHFVCPTFIIHGNRDRVVPFTHGRHLWDRLPSVAQHEFWAVDGGDHNDIGGFDDYIPRVYEFVRHVEESLHVPKDYLADEAPVRCTSRFSCVS
eukprot:TRINITY_DN10362_c0_g1_i1.p1 TRINITY_DN10362_c0_g1~~TRINITY_DN10362_c0_g1_i1.p1  ORF type:complete len:298 (+),score=44.65 TRINITY_DN10362_c0_g1_i1:44-895(+)